MSVTYDLVLATPFSNYDFFTHRMRELCGQMRLDFFVVNDAWVDEFRRKIEAGEVSARVLLDLTANQLLPNDPYTLLAKSANQRGTYVIDNPDTVAISAHKAHFHKKLVANKVPVPETIVVNREDVENFEITDEIRSRIGVPFVVKPAWGDSGVGVNIDAETAADLIRSAEEAPNSDAFLIQKRLVMKDLGRHKGWFRMYYICKTVIACWWDPVSHEYHLVTPAQVRRYRLAPLAQIMRKIGRLSEMQKFSGEICLHEDGKFYAVDYVNADPDMNPRSFYENGVPDEVVRHIVWIIFNEALRIVKRGRGFFDEELEESEADADWLERRRAEQAAAANA